MIKVTPENNNRLALPGGDLSFFIHLKFDFFKQEFKYTFNNLTNLYSKLGGSGSAASGSLKIFATVFLIIWMVQFSKTQVDKARINHRIFIDTNYRKNLHFYKNVVEERIAQGQPLQEDLEKIDKMLEDNEDVPYEGGMFDKFKE